VGRPRTFDEAGAFSRFVGPVWGDKTIDLPTDNTRTPPVDGGPAGPSQLSFLDTHCVFVFRVGLSLTLPPSLRLVAGQTAFFQPFPVYLLVVSTFETRSQRFDSGKSRPIFPG